MLRMSSVQVRSVLSCDGLCLENGPHLSPGKSCPFRLERRDSMADPQPQPKSQLGLEDFIEVASRAALRAVDAHAAAGFQPAIQPQPFPPSLTPAPITPPRIFTRLLAP